MVTIKHYPFWMILPSMTRDAISDLDVLNAARELVDRRGRDAAIEASERARAFAQEARWPEHDLALRVLTLVEQLLDETP